MFDCGPRAFRPLAAIERIFAGHALSPGINAVAVDSQQKNLAAESALETRLEKLDERHLNFAKGDGFNFHSVKSNSPSSLRNTSTARPSGQAKNYRFPAGRVHSLALLIHPQMLLGIALDCDPGLLAHGLAMPGTP